MSLDRRGHWRVVRPAGPDNPLGRLKFPLAGTGSIFLHGTPNKAVFRAGGGPRTLSRGCVRLEDPEALARWLVGEDAREQLASSLAGDRTRVFLLDPPMPAHLAYQTTSIDPRGVVRRHPDVYARDAEALASIDLAAITAAPLEREAPPARLPVLLDPSSGYALDLTVRPLDAAPYHLARFGGRVLLLTLLTPGCEGCRMLAPELAALARDLRAGGEDVALLGVVVDEAEPEALRRVVAEDAPPFDVALGPEELARGETALGPIPQLPVTWVVGRTGVPLYRHKGVRIVPRLRRALGRYLEADRRLAPLPE